MWCPMRSWSILGNQHSLPLPFPIQQVCEMVCIVGLPKGITVALFFFFDAVGRRAICDAPHVCHARPCALQHNHKPAGMPLVLQLSCHGKRHFVSFHFLYHPISSLSITPPLDAHPIGCCASLMALTPHCMGLHHPPTTQCISGTCQHPP